MVKISLNQEKEKTRGASFRLVPKVLKDLEILAVEQEASIQAIVESLVNEFINPDKREISRDSFQYPLEGCKYLHEILSKKQEKNF